MGLILPTSDDQDQNTHISCISYGFSKWQMAECRSNIGDLYLF